MQLQGAAVVGIPMAILLLLLPSNFVGQDVWQAAAEGRPVYVWLPVAAMPFTLLMCYGLGGAYLQEWAWERCVRSRLSLLIEATRPVLINRRNGVGCRRSDHDGTTLSDNTFPTFHNL